MKLMAMNTSNHDKRHLFSLSLALPPSALDLSHCLIQRLDSASLD